MNRRRITAVLVCLVLVIAVPRLFAGGEKENAGQVKLRLATSWVGEDAKAGSMLQIIEAFNASQDRIAVIPEYYGGTEVTGARETLEASFLSGDAPQILFDNVEGAPSEWYAAGYLLDTEPLADKIGKENFKEAAVIEATRHTDGGWLGLPIEGYVWPVWYNKAILDEVGEDVPETWEDLIRVAGKVRAAGYVPWTIGGSDWDFEKVPYLAIAGMIGIDAYNKGLIQADDPSFVDLPGTRAGLELLEKAMAAGVFQDDFAGYDWAGSANAYYEGRALARWDGNWSWGSLTPEVEAVTVLGGFPYPEKGKVDRPLGISAFGAKLFMVTSSAEEVMDEVGEFASFFFKTENIDRFVKDASMISPLADTTVTAAEVSPLLVQSSELFNDLQPVDLVDYAPTEIYEQLIRYAKDFSSDTMDAEKLLAEMRKLYK